MKDKKWCEMTLRFSFDSITKALEFMKLLEEIGFHENWYEYIEIKRTYYVDEEALE